MPARGVASEPCESLLAQHFDAATVTSAEIVAANAPPSYAARAFCRVRITTTPTTDSDISHARHTAIIDRRSERDPPKRPHSPFLLRSDRKSGGPIGKPALK